MKLNSTIELNKYSNFSFVNALLRRLFDRRRG